MVSHMTHEALPNDEELPESELLHALRKGFLDAARNPIPDERLFHLMRTMRIRCHERLASQAVDELKLAGHIDLVTQRSLDFGRELMQLYGIGALALQIESAAGLPMAKSSDQRSVT